MKKSYAISIGLLASIVCIAAPSAQQAFTNPAPVLTTGHAVQARRALAVPMKRTASFVNATNHSAQYTVRVQSADALCAVNLVADGGRADFGRHKVAFATSLADARPVVVTTPGNQRLSFRPAFLAYFDTASGQSVLLGQVQDSLGGIKDSTTVIYEKAIEGDGLVEADVQYLCKHDSLEQNILIHKLVAPDSLGLSSATTRLEMWTEWFDNPQVKQRTSRLTLRPAASGLNAVTADNTALDFGMMKIVQGRAFGLEKTPVSAPVAKEWVELPVAGQQSRTFLVEQVDYKAIEPALQTLTALAEPASKPVRASREQLAAFLASDHPSTHNPQPSTAKQQLSTLNSLARRSQTEAAQPSTGQKGVVLDFALVSSVPLPEGAIAWWPANGDSSDVVGGNNGTLQGGGSIGPGEVGQGFVLDGNSGYVSVPDSDAWAFGGDFTIELWANFATVPDGDIGHPGDGGLTVSSCEGGGNVNKWWFVTAGGQLSFHLNDPDNGPVFLVNADFTPEPGTWYHLAVTRSEDTYTMFVNGVAVGTDTCDRAIPNADAPLRIGLGEDYYFNGTLDEVTMYNRALAPTEIATIYNADGAGKDNPQCAALPANAIAWWPGDGNASDLGGANDGTLINGDYVPGEVLNAFDFDGQDSEMDAPQGDLWGFGSSDFTIELWANFADEPWGSLGSPDGGILVDCCEGPGDVNKWWFEAGDGLLSVHLNDPVNGPVWLVSADFWPDPGAWYHLAVTRSGSTYTIYVNGEPIGTDTSDRVIPSPSAPLRLGSAEDTYYFNGQLDEATIYSRALSGSEIAAIYSAGSAGKCKSDLNGNGIPDWWEWKYFGNLNQTDPNASYDGIDSIWDDFQSGTDPNIIGFSFSVTNNYVSHPNLPVQLSVSGGVPSYWAVLVDDTNYADATWMPYTTSALTANLGATEGWHYLRIGLRGLPADATQTWHCQRIKLDMTPPVITITNPATATVMQPVIQLQGYASEDLAAISYDLNNALGVVTSQQVLVMNRTYSTNTWEFTTNFFQAFDIPLTNGLNTITVHATDLAGNTSATSFNFTLDYSGKNPPVIKLFWPQKGEQICPGTFTWRGHVDDPTATVTARITDGVSMTNTVTALLERNGDLWAENLTMPNASSDLTLTATDAANHTSVTNITITPNPVTVTMTPIDSGHLWYAAVTATGTISDSTYSLWINGVKAGVSGGNWTANNVPMTAGGTAVFNITIYARGEVQPDGSTGN